MTAALSRLDLAAAAFCPALGRVFTAVVALCCPLALAQTVSFVTGPRAMLDDPSIPKLFDPAGHSRTMVGNHIVGDLLGNGRGDIVVLTGVYVGDGYKNMPIRVLRSAEAGSFSDITRQLFGAGELPSSGAPGGPVLGDFNRDGKPDMFVGDFGQDAPPFPGGLNLLLESKTDGTYLDRSATLPNVPDLTHSATSADVNGDGLLDIFVGNLSTINPLARPYFLMGKTDGTFDRVTAGLPAWLLDGTATYTGSYLIDLNGDGHPDLVLGGWPHSVMSGRGRVLLNDGHGDFSKSNPIELPLSSLGSESTTVKIAHVDVNGDGYPDLVMVVTKYYVDAQVQLLINQGDGSFVDETSARLGARATTLARRPWDGVTIADLNGDGRLDIVLTSQWFGIQPGTQLDFAWINQGNGSFAPLATSTLAPTLEGTLVLTDADGDGRPDVVMVNYTDAGSLKYQTFLNSTARTVPSAPLIGTVSPGDARATVAFSPPLSGNSVPITGFVVRCDSRTASVTATGSASPIVVVGMINGVTYQCSVTATSGGGSSLPSYSVALTPALPATGDADGDGIPNGVEASVGRDPLVKDNDVFANTTLFAMQQYRDFLAREGDGGGISFWANQVSTGAQTRAQVIESFFSSNEFQGTIAPVARLYFAYFLRIPDYSGLNFWIGYYRAGHTLDEISNFFAQSSEFQSRYGALDNGQFVNLVYQNVLGRAPDSAGFAFWKNQLDTGARTRGQVMVGFSESNEYRGTSASEIYVTMMYFGMLRRAPDQGGFDFWVQYLDGGNSGLALINGFLGSSEYRGRFLP